jgi:excisionase family DNA binding protein
VTNTTPVDQMLSVQQLAEHLGVSTRTALRKVQDGDIPATKLPGRTGAWVINRRDLPAA